MNVKEMTKVAMIAAVYTAVSLALAPISYGNIQVRIAEALTMVPLVYKKGIWGVTLGCFLTNLIGAMTGVNPTGMIDSVVGTLATFLAAYCTWYLRDRKVNGIPVLAMVMPVIFNFVFVGAELAALYFPETILVGFFISGVEVALGEIVSVILGYFIVKALNKTEIFREN